MESKINEKVALERMDQVDRITKLLLLPYCVPDGLNREAMTRMGGYDLIIEHHLDKPLSFYIDCQIRMRMQYLDDKHEIAMRVPVWMMSEYANDIWEDYLYHVIVPEIKDAIKHLISIVKVRQAQIAHKNIKEFEWATDDLIEKIYPERSIETLNSRSL